MEDKKSGCGCGSKSVVKQPVQIIKNNSKLINKIYKTRTSIFN